MNYRKTFNFVFVFFLFVNAFSQKRQKYFEINTFEDLKQKLNTYQKGDTIFIPGHLSFDVSNELPLVISKPLVLMSDREDNGSQGALFYSNNFKTNPVLLCKANNVEIIGLRFQGPDGKIKQKKVLNQKIETAKQEGVSERQIQRIYVYGIPNSVGIKLYGKNTTIENCEIYGWSHVGIFVEENSKTKIHHSFIHHNQRYGLGYGVLVQGEAEIYQNTFDYNRHAIATSGKPNSSYHAHHNICLEHSGIQSHIFDVHGGVDRKDGTSIAGKKIIINDNIFFINKYQQIFRIRGRSLQKTSVYNNTIYLLKEMENKPFILQTGGKGNLEIRENKIISFIK